MRGGKYQVAIDGPVAAGKSTIARLVAKELGFTYIDSGAMYRALAWAVREHDVNERESGEVGRLMEELEIKLRPRSDGFNEVIVNGREVTDDIRKTEIGQLASRLSTIPTVRRRMVALQQDMARQGGIVMEGRDIQTVVLPEAEVKIFLTAPAEERAERRWKELKGRGINAVLSKVLAEIEERDRRDTTRVDSPLRPAEDAVHIDTGGLTIEQVVARVLDATRTRNSEH